MKSVTCTQDFRNLRNEINGLEMNLRKLPQDFRTSCGVFSPPL